MLQDAFGILVTSTILGLSTLTTAPSMREIASQQIMLNERVPGGGFMSDVMSDNILLTLSYLNEEDINPKQIDWEKVKRSRTLEFKLNPNEVFAFHEDLLPDYEGRVVKTTRSHFNLEQGFKYDGYLMGDGVCHLASLMSWVAKDANLEVNTPTNHDFMSIPGIDRQYGTSIYFMPGSKDANAKQNLYIKNTLTNPILFKFIVDDSKLEAKVFELN